LSIPKRQLTESILQMVDPSPMTGAAIGRARLLYTMLRVGDLDRSLEFYTQQFGMTLSRREDFPDGRFTLAFVGYGDEHSNAIIELTYNWGRSDYDLGSAYGHIAIEVPDVAQACAKLAAAGVKVLREAGPMSFLSPDRPAPEIIAFIEDPDGYRIELIQAHK
jgi:lactoylglutathione lyase